MWVIYEVETGIVREIGTTRRDIPGCRCAPFPGYPPDFDPEREPLWLLEYDSGQLKRRTSFSEDEISKLFAEIEQEAEKKISRAVHKMAPVGEQIGILRDQIVHILNALGIEPTPEFARFNEIAIKEIEAARKKKEAIHAQDDSA